MVKTCKECNSTGLDCRDFTVKNGDPETGEVISMTTFTTLQCKSCGWVSLGLPDFSLSD